MIPFDRVGQSMRNIILAVLEKHNTGINENFFQKEINLIDKNYVFSLKFPIDFSRTKNGENTLPILTFNDKT